MNLILLVLALLCEIVATLAGFDVLISAEHILAWISLGLVFWILSLLVGPVMGYRRSE